jgi:hypothetical protein
MFRHEKDIEICAVKLHILSHTINIITVYRSPTNNIAYFVNNLEAALNQGYSVSGGIVNILGGRRWTIPSK